MTFDFYNTSQLDKVVLWGWIWVWSRHATEWWTREGNQAVLNASEALTVLCRCRDLAPSFVCNINHYGCIYTFVFMGLFWHEYVDHRSRDSAPVTVPVTALVLVELGGRDQDGRLRGRQRALRSCLPFFFNDSCLSLCNALKSSKCSQI